MIRHSQSIPVGLPSPPAPVRFFRWKCRQLHVAFCSPDLRVFQPYTHVSAVMKDIPTRTSTSETRPQLSLMVMEHRNPAQSTIPSSALTTRSSVGPSYASMQLHSDIRPIVWRRAAGTSRQIVDLVPANINLEPTYERRAEWEEFEKRGWWGSWFTWWNPSHGRTYAKVPVVGTLLEEEWIHRHGMKGVAGLDYQMLEWVSPLFANGTIVPPGGLLAYRFDTLTDLLGSYRILLRMLKITGDRARGKDYETYLSPVVVPLCVISLRKSGSQFLHYKLTALISCSRSFNCALVSLRPCTGISKFSDYYHSDALQ